MSANAYASFLPQYASDSANIFHPRLPRPTIPSFYQTNETPRNMQHERMKSTTAGAGCKRCMVFSLAILRPWSSIFTFAALLLALLAQQPIIVAAQDIYAPFSGAVYIVGADGVQISAASPAYCPQYAALSCSGIGYANWCCPTDHTCQYLSSSSVVACCPSGQTCSGTVNAQSITTVTVTVVQTQTQYVQPQTTTQYVGPAYVQPTTTAYVGAAGGGVYAGYCSTLIADGPGLPTTRAGDCGTILVVSGAWEGAHGGRGWYGWGVPIAVVANTLIGAWLAGVRRFVAL